MSFGRNLKHHSYLETLIVWRPKAPTRRDVPKKGEATITPRLVTATTALAILAFTATRMIAAYPFSVTLSSTRLVRSRMGNRARTASQTNSLFHRGRNRVHHSRHPFMLVNHKEIVPNNIRFPAHFTSFRANGVDDPHNLSRYPNQQPLDQSHELILDAIMMANSPGLGPSFEQMTGLSSNTVSRLLSGTTIDVSNSDFRVKKKCGRKCKNCPFRPKDQKKQQ
mmetsp:Transcript_15688/g.30636  ORF Transcript_15688/g.30636 Transcript_15688/m.30636 type:complete len:223 (+) Transcript_15688:27-695(+)